jgi:branched-chain amino acid aminotransferase
VTLLREAGLPVQERPVDRSELYLADELFFLGTAWEILPVAAVDSQQVGDGELGPVTRRLQREYGDLVRGGSGRHGDWLTEVALPSAGELPDETVKKGTELHARF